MSSAAQAVWRLVKFAVPWLITAAALYFAFRGVDFGVLISHLHEADPSWLILAIFFTMVSYLLRSARWQRLFPHPTLNFANAARVLILGFFMNNILPARAGEFVRAHLGAKISGEKRTLVLATVASERLVDGLTISCLFVLFALGLGDQGLSHNLLYVAYLFLAAAIATLAVIYFQDYVAKLLERFTSKVDSKASHYTSDRIQVFIHGLSPLSKGRTAPRIAVWSAAIWTVELLVYAAVAKSFSAPITAAGCVLFLVAVNFSALIPAAPGGLGVIEAVAKAALMSIGIEGELALTMAIAQHAIQYGVVGIPGAIVMLQWRKIIQQVPAAQENVEETEVEPPPVRYVAGR